MSPTLVLQVIKSIDIFCALLHLEVEFDFLLVKAKFGENKPKKLSAFKREQRAKMPRNYASAMQVL